jgi:hypothetical protein
MRRFQLIVGVLFICFGGAAILLFLLLGVGGKVSDTEGLIVLLAILSVIVGGRLCRGAKRG